MEQVCYEKNRNRNKPTFANINFVGKCNARCFFCLGKQACDKPSELFNTHFSKWVNFEKYLELCKERGVQKLYLTGLDSEPSIYPHVQELVEYLKEKGFLVGIRTNGLVADEKLYRTFNEEIGVSLHSLNPDTLKKIGIGLVDLPSLLKKLEGTKHRYAIVVNRYNENEVLDLIDTISKADKNCYIQIRQLCDDNGLHGDYYEDILAFERVAQKIEDTLPRKSEFETAPIYTANGVEVCVWRPLRITVNSLNYFTNGKISDNYFVIEGWKEK